MRTRGLCFVAERKTTVIFYVFRCCSRLASSGYVYIRTSFHWCVCGEFRNFGEYEREYASPQSRRHNGNVRAQHTIMKTQNEKVMYSKRIAAMGRTRLPVSSVQLSICIRTQFRNVSFLLASTNHMFRWCETYECIPANTYSTQCHCFQL